MKCVVSIGSARWVAPNAALAGRLIDLLGECSAMDGKYSYPCPEGGRNELLFPAQADSYPHTGRIDPLSRFEIVADASEADAIDAARKEAAEAIAAKEGGAP